MEGLSGEANEFLQHQAGDDIFSSQLKPVAGIRKREKKKKKLNAGDRKYLCEIYEGVASLARYSDPNLFTKHVPELEITAWFDHVTDVLQEKVNDSHWIRTGTLLVYDEHLLGSFSKMVNQPLPAVMAFEETKILEILTSMMKSRKGNSDVLPGPNFVHDLTFIICGLVECGTRVFDNPWTPYRVFKKLEKTGILEQYLRCSAIPSVYENVQKQKDVDKQKEFILQQLLGCTEFVGERLKAGTPCGNTLRSILDERDGRPTAICSLALPFLRSLAKLSTLLQIVDCEHCKEGGLWKNVMRCGACRQANYCSKKCQRADWKEHKKSCSRKCQKADWEEHKKSSSEANHIVLKQVSSTAVRQILKGTYVEIMVRLVEESDRAGGLEMKDMILEIDLKPDRCGNIPFLQDPPQFQIIPSARYLDGTRYRELLVANGCEDVETKVENFVKDFCSKMPKSDYLLCFEYHPTNLLRRPVLLYTEETRESMVTQEAVDAFRNALVHDDYGRLSDLFESRELVESYTHQIRTLKSAGAV